MKSKRRGRGEGCITQLRDGRWLAVMSAGNNPSTGKRRQRKFYGRTKKEVQEKLREAQTARAKGTLTDAGRMTVGEWLDKWLDIKKGKIQPGTWDFYEQRVRLYLKPAVGAVPLGKITALDVEEMFAHMRKNDVPADAQHKSAGILRSALKEAVRKHLIAVNPAMA